MIIEAVPWSFLPLPLAAIARRDILGVSLAWNHRCLGWPKDKTWQKRCPNYRNEINKNTPYLQLVPNTCSAIVPVDASSLNSSLLSQKPNSSSTQTSLKWFQGSVLVQGMVSPKGQIVNIKRLESSVHIMTIRFWSCSDSILLFWTKECNSQKTVEEIQCNSFLFSLHADFTFHCEGVPRKNL